MGLTQISTDGVKANTLTKDDIASSAITVSELAVDAVEDDRIKTSNSPSASQFLQYKNNSDKLTWADAASEGTDIKSTGESGTAKFLRVDGDGTCSWQVPPVTDISGKANLSGADFTGEVALKDNTHQLKFYDDDDSAYLHFKAPSTVASNVNWTLPAADGSSDQVLKTNGSGTLSWTTISASPSVTAVADGALAAGDPVYMKSDGKVKKIHTSTIPANAPTEQIAATQTVGTSALAGYVRIDTSPNGISCVYYRDHATSGYPAAYRYHGHFYAFKLNTAGTGYQFTGNQLTDWDVASHEGQVQYVCTNNGNDVFMVGYTETTNGGNRMRHRAVMVTPNASGTNPSSSMGSENNTATSSGSDHHLCKFGDADDYTCVYIRCPSGSDSIESYIISYDNSSSSVGSCTSNECPAMPGNATPGRYAVCVWDPDDQKVLVHFRHNGVNGHQEGGKGHTNWMDIYGQTTMASSDWGTRQPWNTNASDGGAAMRPQDIGACYDKASQRHVISFRDEDDSSDLKIMVGQNNGSTMTWGTAVLVDASGSSPCLKYHEGIERTIIEWNNSSNVLCYAIVSVDASSNTPTVGTTFTSNDKDSRGHIANNTMAYDAQNKFMITSFQDNDDGSKGKSTAIKVEQASSTSTQFIGFNQGAVSSGGNATIDIVGATNSHQSGLTVGSRYYVGTTGTLSTTAASPSVEAGTAIAADKIIVKG